MQQIDLDTWADENLPPKLTAAIRNTLIEGADLIDESTVGVFIGIIDGELLSKTQMRVPIKKAVVFLLTLTILAWVMISIIYPFVMSFIALHIQ